jgi:hypothetical protein
VPHHDNIMMMLSPSQQQMLADIAAKLPPEKREAFRDRCEALLISRVRRGRLGDDEIITAGELALASLLAHKPVA